MKSSLILILACSFTAALLVGCMHTVVGGNPDPSPDGRYALGMEYHGASAKAFTDRTRKRVYLWLVSNAARNHTTYIDKKYVFTASDLSSDITWADSSEMVKVNFYDYGEGIFSSDARKRGIPSNHIATLTFVWDATRQKFVEKK